MRTVLLNTVRRIFCRLAPGIILLCVCLAQDLSATPLSPAHAQRQPHFSAVEADDADVGMFKNEGFVGVPVVLTPLPAREIPKAWKSLAAKLVADGFDPEYIANIFCDLGDSYSSAPMGNKVLELYRIKMNRTKPKADSDEDKEPDAAAIAKGALPGIQPGVLTANNMSAARKFLAEHETELQSMKERFGVDPEIAAAILLVETGLGTFLGKEGALKSLASMATCRDPEEMRPYLKGYAFNDATLVWLQDVMPRRADWAYSELKALLDYGRDGRADILAMPGSVYGAVGLCQFMPSNIKPYGVDATGKGWADLFTVPDAVHSLANYLKEHGWQENLSAAEKHGIIMRYNHSARYANTIITVADYLKTPPGTPLPKAAFQSGGYKTYKYKPPTTPVKPRKPEREGRYYGDVPLP